MGFRLDTASIYAGISISSNQWRSIALGAEIIGIRNVRASVASPETSMQVGQKPMAPSAKQASANQMARQ